MAGSGAMPVLLAVAVTVGGGCVPAAESSDSAVDFQVDVSLSERIPTVAEVTWTADAGSGGDLEDPRVEFGLDATYGMEAPASSGEDGSFSTLLLGTKSSREYHFRVAGLLDGVPVSSEDEVLTTGPGPSDLPELSVPVADPTRAAGGYFVLSLLSFPAAAVIVDADGDYVWWHTMEVAELSLARTVPSRDLQRMLYMSLLEAGDEDYEHHLFRMPLDGDGEASMAIAQAHHDFVELPDGTVTVIAHDQRVVGEELVVGDRLVEYRPDGSEVEVWSIWDHLEYEEPVNQDVGTSWSHSNALDYSAADDSYTLGVRNFDMLLTIDRATGEVIETLGGDDSDYILVGADARWFDKAHQFDRDGDEILVFSNGHDVETGSQVLGYHLDPEAGEATMLWEYRAAFPLYCYTYGDVNRLPSGNVLVTWSTAGQMEEVSGSGEVLWQLKANLGAGFGYTTWMESLYPP